MGGYPLRPGETPCAFYLRTGICKFNSCKFDHPENVTPMNPGASPGGSGVIVGNLAAQLAALGDTGLQEIASVAALGAPQPLALGLQAKKEADQLQEQINLLIP